MTGASRKGHLVFIGMGIALVTCRIIGSMILPVYDDAFITLRYSRNLARGDGFVYHPDEWVLGTTCIGFGLINSLFYLLGLPMPQTAVVMNIISDVVIFYTTVYAIPRNERHLFGVLFGGLFAVSPIMTRISIGGMEMSLYLVCSILSILFYYRQFKKTAIILAVFCYYLRPEALILLGLLCAMEWLSGKKANSLKLGILGILALSLPLIVVFSFYGQVIPQSVIAKSTSLAKPSFFDVIKQLLAPDPLIVVLIPLAIWGFFVNVKQAGFSKIVGVWSMIYVTVYTIARPKMWSWYGMPVYYAVLLLATTGSINLIKRLPQLSKTPLLKWLSPVVGGLAIAVWVVLWVRIGSSGVTKYVYEPLKAWCKENIKEGTSILAGDIGAIGYYSDARIYDLAGLVWPDALSFKSATDVIQTYLPDYLFLTATRDTVEMMSGAPLNSLYKPVARFSKTNISDLELDEDNYPHHWVQDYIMFKKQDLEQLNGE